MKPLGLSPAQLAERRKGIGGSDAAKIISGEWYDLWLDKTGRKEPEDLSGVLAVMMGHATEDFNAFWYEKLHPGSKIVSRGEVEIWGERPFMRCSLDGIIDPLNAVWQAKHVNAFSKIEEVVARYTPQVTHEMIVTGCDKAVLSVFIGTDKYEAVEVGLEEFFASAYIERCVEFWGYVERDEPPPGAPALAVPVPAEKLRKVSMEGNNRWSMFAADWLANKTAAATFDVAVKGIKALVESDVGEASGHGIIVKRDKRGLSIKESK